MASIDPLMESLDYPELMRSSTLSPTSAIYDPFSNIVPVESTATAVKEESAVPVEDLGWTEDLTNFEFKVPSIGSSPNSLGSQYSPLRLGRGRMSPMNLNRRNPFSEEASTPPHDEPDGSKDESRTTSDSKSGSGSEGAKSQSSDYEPPTQRKLQRKRGTRKRKATPQSRRVRQENNKRAAARYRQKRKEYVNELEHKVDTLNQALDQKDAELSRLQNKNSSLAKQIEFFKNLLGKNPAMKAQAALQMFVCVFAVVLGVMITYQDAGLEMSHHRKVLSVDSLDLCQSWGSPTWAPSSVWGFGHTKCFDASVVVSLLRIAVHIVVVPILVWLNFYGFEKNNSKKAAAGSPTRRASRPVSP